MTIVKPKQRRKRKNDDWTDEVEVYYTSGQFEKEKEALSESAESSDSAQTDRRVLQIIRETVYRNEGKRLRHGYRLGPVRAGIITACVLLVICLLGRDMIPTGNAAPGRQDMDTVVDKENMISISIVDEGMQENYTVEIPAGYELIIEKTSYKKFMNKSTGKVFDFYFGNMSWITGYFPESIESVSIEKIQNKKIFHYFSGKKCYTFYGPKDEIAFLIQSSDLSSEELGQIISTVTLH